MYLLLPAVPVASSALVSACRFVFLSSFFSLSCVRVIVFFFYVAIIAVANEIVIFRLGVGFQDTFEVFYFYEDVLQL